MGAVYCDDPTAVLYFYSNIYIANETSKFKDSAEIIEYLPLERSAIRPVAQVPMMTRNYSVRRHVRLGDYPCGYDRARCPDTKYIFQTEGTPRSGAIALYDERPATNLVHKIAL